MVQPNVGDSDGYTWSKIKTEDGTVGYFANEYLTPVNTVQDTYSVPSQPAETGENLNKEVGVDYKVEGNKIITEPGTTLKDIKNKYTVVSAKKDGKDVKDTDLLGTGTVITTNTGTYTVAKLGDVSGDGIIDARDSLRILKYTVDTYTIENEYLKASDLNQDNVIDARDSLRILKYTVDTYSIKIN